MIYLPGPDGEVKAYPQSEVEQRLAAIKASKELRDKLFQKFVFAVTKVKE